MKHAILICAHGDMTITKNTISILDDDEIDFYVHVDAKSNCDPYVELAGISKYSKIVIVPRKSMWWGTYSLIECEMELLKASYLQRYDYYHLISGQDLPIKPKKCFLQFFESTKEGTEFVSFWGSNGQYWNRINYKYPFLKLYHRASCEFLNNVEKLILTRILRKRDNKYKYFHDKVLYAGSQWFDITHQLVLRILEQAEWIEAVFKDGYTVDELFVQTVLGNALDLSRNISNVETRLIDFERGKPYVFRYADLDEILSSSALFCRKFDVTVDRDIVREITNRMMSIT